MMAMKDNLPMEFKILKKSKKSKARLGIIKTSHGVLDTPAFFPVATQGTIKTLDSKDLKEIGYQGILCNTYHLFLRPGSSLIKKQGGLHKFINYQGVIMTDSGGFQVFSLGKGMEQAVGKIPKPKRKETTIRKPGLVRIREEGVYFNSHLDGQEQFLSPEKSIRIQRDLGADIIFAFDECTSPFDDLAYTKKAMARTHRWAERSLKARQSKNQALFGIVQGGGFKNLRRESAQFIASLDFDGFGIGGWFGENKERMFKTLAWTISFLPQNKPRHLLGIGYLADIKKAVESGIDTFDCVYPTRFARHGIAMTEKELLDFKKARFLSDKKPIDRNCRCFVCQNHSRSFICHLLRAKEMTAQRLLTYHNLWFFKKYLEGLRKDIKRGNI